MTRRTEGERDERNEREFVLDSDRGLAFVSDVRNNITQGFNGGWLKDGTNVMRC